MDKYGFKNDEEKSMAEIPGSLRMMLTDSKSPESCPCSPDYSIKQMWCRFKDRKPGLASPIEFWRPVLQPMCYWWRAATVTIVISLLIYWFGAKAGFLLSLSFFVIGMYYGVRVEKQISNKDAVILRQWLDKYYPKQKLN